MPIRRRPPEETPAEVPLAPMIDVVFLLLIYFMVSATLQRQEADISFQLPGSVELAAPLDLPEEQIVEITAEGQVLVNEFAVDSPEAPRFEELAGLLSRFRQNSEAARLEAAVTIAPDDGTPHRFVIMVMDACTAAGITAVHFALEGGD
ncbi:MAG: biopolymer transporter ExbD [Puniceicoccaceae bacterium]|nr:MAG: biopolymer transporter ExbD [Puniceicoccaceae bacterium]